jgi:hypothetical protein
MNGNVTETGIKLDLEWMHRIGIGGVQTFDAAWDTPTVVDRRLEFMTPAWNEAFEYAVKLANELDIELAIAGSPGWSESGGPWVRPEQSMKKLVWTEIQVAGGAPLARGLVRPSDTVGPFQGAPVDRHFGSFAGPAPLKPVPTLYRDVAVLAYRLPNEDRSMSELNPTVTSSAGAVDPSVLWNADFIHALQLPYGEKDNPAWIQFDFGHNQRVESMTLGLRQNLWNTWLGLVPRHIDAELQSSSDGMVFHSVATAYDSGTFPPQGPPLQQTVTFPPVTARYFRLALRTPPVAEIPASVATALGPIPASHQVTEFVLYTAPRVDHFEQKAGYFLDSGKENPSTFHKSANEIVNHNDVIDLTSKLLPDGTLNWIPPEGRWAVLRMGYSLLGITNHPASPEGTGLEVDKLSGSAVRSYMDDYLGRYQSIVGSALMGQHGLRAMVLDSYEAGPQNWTETLPEEFVRRRGYNLRQWLPALTGRIIDSAEDTDKFLWDFRRTLGELLAENHYGQMTASLHERRMIHYGESHELGRAFIGDGMDVKSRDDIPMGAMWMPGPMVAQEQCDLDIRESASVAHIYGQNLVAAESLTAFGTAGVAYAYAPESLKPTADRELVDGLNLFVVHTSAHQPLVDKSPGVALGPYGQWFTRHETWAEMATPWVTYLARSSYLLQQGHFVADILYYYGQDSNITALYATHAPEIPQGFAFDFASADALNMLTVRDGYLNTPSGMHYRLLVLDPRARLMSLDVLKQIAHLVEAGATIVGEKPSATPSLADDASEFGVLSDALWGDGAQTLHQFGGGRVLSGISLAHVASEVNLKPDFEYTQLNSDAIVWFVHRRLADGDLYFVDNRRDREAHIEARFRVVGKAPEFWHADSGVIEPASYRQEGDRTVVPMNLDPNDAVFVIFRKSTTRTEREIEGVIREPLITIAGSWQVHFQSGRGAPSRAIVEKLRTWSEFADPRIKFFSGTATYEKSFFVPAAWLTNGQSKEIDLGDVKNLAEVVVNGRSTGILWKAPFRTAITGLLHAGTNHVVVRVTNLWPNRLIGDQQPNAKPVAFTTFNPYSADSPLLNSGLLGPVRILNVRRTGHGVGTIQ